MPIIAKKTISETILERMKLTPEAIGFQYRAVAGGPWTEVSFAQFFREAEMVSAGLRRLGVKAAEKVAILSNTRYEWSLCDVAILGMGAITVPIYASNLPEDVAYIAEHSEACVLFVEDLKQLQKVLGWQQSHSDALPHLRKIVLFGGQPSRELAQNPHVLTLAALKEMGTRDPGFKAGLFAQTLQRAEPHDLITICYTSGTTGVPKGVMLTHDNLMSVLEDCASLVVDHIEPSREVLVSFLPVSHIFGKVESMAIYTFGWRQVFAESIDQLMNNVAEIQPTLLFAVPRIFEKGYNRIHSAVAQATPVRRRLFEWALGVGRRYYQAQWQKKRPSPLDALQYPLAKKLVFSKINKVFGGRLRFAICGGAPFAQEMGEFFQIVGITILEGYGLTETCAPVALMSPAEVRFGVVGPPLAEVQLRFDTDGELLVKSRKNFVGYYKMPEETKTAFVSESSKEEEQSWFRTGDIGLIDSAGFLKITDRKKDLIVTSGGKNVAPQKIENLAKSRAPIAQCMVHGDRRNFLTALLTLEQDQVIRFAQQNQILYSGYPELVRHPKVVAWVQGVINELNGNLPSFETIKKFIILPVEFTIETGELTPSLKVRRNVLNKRYQQDLDALYSMPLLEVAEHEIH